MYTSEIVELVKLKKYLIEYEEYIKICDSPQVDHVDYSDGQFNIFSNDGLSIRVKVKEREINDKI